MKYAFDQYGWFTAGEIGGRMVDAEPPEHGPVRIAGEPWPNWSGIGWDMVPYVAPPAAEPTPDPVPLVVDGQKLQVAVSLAITALVESGAVVLQ